jgi:hypothetical protein
MRDRMINEVTKRPVSKILLLELEQSPVPNHEEENENAHTIFLKITFHYNILWHICYR